MANATAAKWTIWPARLLWRLSFWVSLGLAGLGLAGAVHAAPPLPEMSHSLTLLKPTQPAVNFSLPDLDGKLHALSDYRGKVVLVNFWASWCPPCRREMPSMERLLQKLNNQPFAILAINEQETLDQVFVFTGLLDPAPTYPLLFDRDSAIANAWKVQGLPASFIVDKQGRVVYRAMGGRDFDHPELEQRIRALLKSPPAIKP